MSGEIASVLSIMISTLTGWIVALWNSAPGSVSVVGSGEYLSLIIFTPKDYDSNWISFVRQPRGRLFAFGI